MSSIPQKLAAGIYGRLEFDYACNRAHGFSESHMHGVMNEILASNVDPTITQIKAGFPPAALQTPGLGRKREVDFALISRATSTPTHYMEAKWAGSSHCDEKNVLLDVSRLALLNQADPESLCLFVLAGGKSNVERLLNTGALAPHGKAPSRVLAFPYSGARKSYRLGSRLTFANRRYLEDRLPRIPQGVLSLLYKPSHDETPDWKCYVWRVTGVR